MCNDDRNIFHRKWSEKMSPHHIKKIIKGGKKNCSTLLGPALKKYYAITLKFDHIFDLIFFKLLHDKFLHFDMRYCWALNGLYTPSPFLIATLATLTDVPIHADSIAIFFVVDNIV